MGGSDPVRSNAYYLMLQRRLYRSGNQATKNLHTKHINHICRWLLGLPLDFYPCQYILWPRRWDNVSIASAGSRNDLYNMGRHLQLCSPRISLICLLSANTCTSLRTHPHLLYKNLRKETRKDVSDNCMYLSRPYATVPYSSMRNYATVHHMGSIIFWVTPY